MIVIYTSPYLDKGIQKDTPFLQGTLLEFSKFLFQSIHNTDIQFYHPQSWNEADGYSSLLDIPVKGDFVVILPVDYLPLQELQGTFLGEDLSYGMVDKIEDLLNDSSTGEPESFVQLTPDNYAKVSSFYLSRLQAPETELFYGNPIVLSQKIENSRIFGPCFIDRDSVITDCTIYPGTVIRNSRLTNSTVTSSSVINSVIRDSEIDTITSFDSELKGMRLKNSLLSRGTHLNAN